MTPKRTKQPSKQRNGGSLRQSIDRLTVESMETMIRWLMVSVFIYAATNWFLIPQFPGYVEHISILASLGIGGLGMIGFLMMKGSLVVDKLVSAR